MLYQWCVQGVLNADMLIWAPNVSAQKKTYKKTSATYSNIQRSCHSWYPPFKSGLSFNLSSHSSSGLQGPPFQPINITYDPMKQS